jgi:hypothetical protein
MGEMEVYFHHFVPRHQMVSGLLQAPTALTLGKETLVPNCRGAWIGPTAGLDNVDNAPAGNRILSTQSLY